jgi:peptidase C13-like protein
MNVMLSSFRILAIALTVALFASQAGAGDFSGWGAIVVAGDDHAHSGAPSLVFDNARRDLATALAKLGVAPGNILQFSVQPGQFPNERVEQSDPGTVASRLWDLSNRTSAGCFLYFTSHGSPDGIVLGDQTFSPNKMKQIVANACGDRPTVVVVSACYSGVFVPALAAPNRLVLTAARPDRTSFGCGESDRYTFFDSCFLQSLQANRDFPDLAQAVRTCVAAREKKEQVDYPSEPQLAVGQLAARDLPHWK